MVKPPIKNLTEAELRAWLQQHQYPGWRVRQLWKWLYQDWAMDFPQMNNLPTALREKLAANFSCNSLEFVESLVDPDQTSKQLFRLADRELIETVLIPTETRQTVCISSQVGCPVGCAFCATGRQGFVRNLQVAEMIDQVIHCCRKAGRRISHIVVMGMGEPLLNLDHTVTALDRICDPSGLGISARRITISTTGIPDRIFALAELSRPWNLAWSLHGGDDAIRARIIPADYRFPIEKIAEACQYYRNKTGRKVTIEYALLGDLNDRPSDARKVAEIARTINAKVNLIPYNPSGSSHAVASARSIEQFTRILESRRVTVTLRQSRGRKIMAACGQLSGRRKHEKLPTN